WHLPAPSGTRRLAATIPAIAHAVLALSPGVGGSLVSPAVWATGQFALPHPAGILLDYEWVQGEGAPVPVSDLCYTYDPPALDTAVQSVPPPVCPDGDGYIVGTPVIGSYQSLAYDGVGRGWFETYLGGTWGVKEATAFVGAARWNGIRLLWLDVG
ncbi:MAG: hypothetical protein ACYDAQ_19660, partial [Mycobacteriales bacterium]